MASNNGSGMVAATPPASMPRRTVRRLRGLMVMGTVSSLLRRYCGECVVSNRFDDQISQLVTGGLKRSRQSVHDAAVDVPLRVARGVRVIAVNEALSDVGIRAHRDAQRLRVGHRHPVEIAGRVNLETAVRGARATDRVVRLQGQAEWVHQAMTGRA